MIRVIFVEQLVCIFFVISRYVVLKEISQNRYLWMEHINLIAVYGRYWFYKIKNVAINFKFCCGLILRSHLNKKLLSRLLFSPPRSNSSTYSDTYSVFWTKVRCSYAYLVSHKTYFYLLYFYLLYKYYIFYVISKMNNRDISDQSYFESINSNKSVVT